MTTLAGAIQTKRLSMTPFTERHINDRYLGWLNDKTLMRYSEQRHRRHTRESALEYLRSFHGSSNYFWAIEEIPDGLGHIGNINAYVDRNNLVADIGILIGEPAARKKGYGLEAWKGVCGFLLGELGMRKITAGTMARNLPMIHLMQRAGMIPDGIRKRHYLLEGLEVDILHMAVFQTAEPSKKEEDAS
ncbi:MAG: GNAT family N-acetyltransferase [Thermodesulfobacteriota bacterium]